MASERIEGTAAHGTTGAGRAGRTPAGREQSADPAVLVAQIEAPREDLAQTLDAIAEKVSPKRVAQRGTERAKELAASAKVVLAERTAGARETVGEKAALARTAIADSSATARQAVADRTGAGHDPGSVAVGTAGAGPAAILDDPGAGTLPPTTAVRVPGLPVRSGGPAGAAPGSVLGLPRETVAGAVAAVVVALWLLRRRGR